MPPMSASNGDLVVKWDLLIKHKFSSCHDSICRSQQKIARTLDIDITYGDERRTTRDYGRDRGDRDIRRNNRPSMCCISILFWRKIC